LITIPASLSLKQNKKAERLLGEAARKWIEVETRVPGVHATDLLDPRQAVYRILQPKPMADRLVNIFLIGKVLHAFVLQTVDGISAVDISTTDAGSFSSEKLGITYSPDKISGGLVRELKTSRSYTDPKSLEDVRIYVEQILVYMAATETLTAELWVLFLNLRDPESGKLDPVFRGYTISISDEDLAQLIIECRATRDTILNAVEVGDPHLLPLCRDWKCNRKLCDWFDACKPEGRYAPETVKVRAAKPRSRKGNS